MIGAAGRLSGVTLLNSRDLVSQRGPIGRDLADVVALGCPGPRRHPRVAAMTTRPDAGAGADAVKTSIDDRCRVPSATQAWIVLTI